MSEYDPQRIETEWQEAWRRRGFWPAPARPAPARKYYCLVMYPYPSGRIHMGHVRNYAIGDALARYRRQEGCEVLHPIGWDAFGLPAENAAIDRGIHPAKWTYDNIAHMKRQLQRLGISYDWSREVTCCAPDYYRWGQWFFLKLYENARALAYRSEGLVNFCPSCETILANEQVEEGRCWRCESVIELRRQNEWKLRITAYAEELLGGLDDLKKGWPSQVLEMQRNWIGRSTGAHIVFPVVGEEAAALTVFTTRVDTLFGCTYMVLAPEHPLTGKLCDLGRCSASGRREIDEMMRTSKARRTDESAEKVGVDTGARCVNPATGDQIPIYVANYVVMDYGTGAVMCVPTHDQRDFEFAKKYGLPLRVVIEPPGVTLKESEMRAAYEGDGVLARSGPFDGLSNREAMEKMAGWLKDRGQGGPTVTYRLRDWGISRQRYWGNPIPIVYCDGCGIVPVPYPDLPVRLPEQAVFSAHGGNPLNKAADFVNTACPSCGKPARRETDTMDTFVDSSWYFARYTDPTNAESPVDRDKADAWLPVDQYIGGIEHACMHLLYARFFHKVMRDLGLVSSDEPFARLLTQGMVRKETHACAQHGYLYPEEVTAARACGKCGAEVSIGRVEKMSKSKKNVVDPDEMVKKYGIDTIRLFILFAAPPEGDLDWSESGVQGCYRFLKRVWRQIDQAGEPGDASGEDAPADRVVYVKLQQTIAKFRSDISGRFQFNTAIAACMELLNVLESSDVRPAMRRSAMKAMLALLSSLVPHIAAEGWRRLGFPGEAEAAPLPEPDRSALVAERVTIGVQVNGKIRDRIEVAADADESTVARAVLALPKVAEMINGKRIEKQIYVPKRLFSVVVS
ncbi:MAG: leucine--tRNA ligase [Candidatus Lindowbacteria bacterium RIFCSPLOWO2_12_FULL_62_27]|nr:MAG: leucine--tRNA ligase [Candidatus Lindowbacteria bacterium RIFCSPLOWO2_12_FULL_62_27]